MRDGEVSDRFVPDEALEKIEDSVERLINIEEKLDGLTARYDARDAEMRERLIHAEEKLDFLLERQPHRPARPIAFLHVPKTAGTSLTEALIEAARPRCVVGGFDESLFGGFSDFSSFAPERRREVYAGPHQISPFCDMLAGHFSLSTIRGWAADAAIVMVLREPCARLLSHWTFWRAEAGLHTETLGAWNKVLAGAQGSLFDFLLDPSAACQTDNVAARMLLWPHRLIPEDGFISPAHDEVLLAEAKRHLAGLACVNIVENPDLCADLAGWLQRPFTMRRVKVTASVPAHLQTNLNTELTAETRAMWLTRTRLDRQLWALTARRALPDADIPSLRDEVLGLAVERYRALLAG